MFISKRTFHTLIISGATSVMLAAPVAFAVNRDFASPSRGIMLGVGTYEAFGNKALALRAPIAEISPTGTDIVASHNLRLLPVTLGMFANQNRLLAEGFLRYWFALGNTWTAQGNQTGSGSTHYSSYGVGGRVGYALIQNTRYRLIFSAMGEYLSEQIALSFQDDVAGAESLSLRSPTTLFGGGFQNEIWLGDLWTLSIFSGYQVGYSQDWNVTKDSSNFLGKAYTAGPLPEARTGNPVKPNYSGFLLEANFKLAFY